MGQGLLHLLRELQVAGYGWDQVLGCRDETEGVAVI